MSAHGPIQRLSVPAQVPRRVWNSTLWMALGRMWGAACTLLTLWILAERLGTAGIGRLTFYLAIFLVLDAAVDLGSGQAALRSVAANPRDLAAVLVRARRLRLILGLAAMAGTSTLAFAAGEADAAWIALASLYPITHALELSNLGLRNRIRWGRLVLVRAGAASASLFAVLALHSQGESRPAVYLAGIAAGSTVGNFAQHFACRRFLPATLGVASAPLGPFLRLAVPMGVAALCQQLYFWQDNLVLRAYHGDSELGPYNLAVRCMSYGILLAVYASAAALPWLTRQASHGGVLQALRRLIPPLFIPAGIAVALAWPWTESILAVFGADFRVAGPSLRWLLLAILCVSVGAPCLTGVVAMGHSNAVLGIAVSALVVNLAFNLLWVPSHGALGAARATCLTELVVALLSLATVLIRSRSKPAVPTSPQP